MVAANCERKIAHNKILWPQFIPSEHEHEISQIFIRTQLELETFASIFRLNFKKRTFLLHSSGTATPCGRYTFQKWNFVIFVMDCLLSPVNRRFPKSPGTLHYSRLPIFFFLSPAPLAPPSFFFLLFICRFSFNAIFSFGFNRF